MPLIANIVGLVTCLLRSVWVLILSNSYHFAVRHSSIENGRFSLSDLICALTFGFFLLLCILFILLFIYTLCVYLLLDFLTWSKDQKGLYVLWSLLIIWKRKCYSGTNLLLNFMFMPKYGTNSGEWFKWLFTEVKHMNHHV